MEFFAYSLVLISAFTHAYWNFVLKQAGGTQVFIGLSKIVEMGLFLVPFVYLVVKNEIALLDYWLFYVVGALLVIFNYLFLGQAYTRGELSLVYPISRTGALLFLPILAFVLIDEKVDVVGIIAILLILSGLLAIQLRGFSLGEISNLFSKLNSPAIALAILAAFTTAGYTLWDKYSISFLSPFIYFYAYTAIVAVSYAIFILVKNPLSEIRGEWARHKFSIVQVGFFNTFSYLLVLYSLQTGKASYVIALRQLSIAFGVVLGWKLLGEAMPIPKTIGVATLLAGCFLISLAR
ncbi:MAG: EamA family transporter [Pyrinomonadaceae bacterium]